MYENIMSTRLDITPSDPATVAVDEAIIKRNRVRLTAAFRDLRKQGYLAKQDYTCCQSCGTWEVWYEAAGGARRVKGAAFYHQQDREIMTISGQLRLAFTSFADLTDPAAPEPDTSMVAVAEAAVLTLRRHGLAASWDGSPRTRIAVDMRVDGTADMDCAGH